MFIKYATFAITKFDIFWRFTIAYVPFLCYICGNRFRHASHRTAYQGGTFAFYTMNKYNNKALSIQEQIERLKKNGLIIDDVNQANKTLSIISYFRLASYWRPMEEKDQEQIGKWNRFGKHKKKNIPKTTVHQRLFWGLLYCLFL